MGSSPNATQAPQSTDTPLTPEEQRLRSMNIRELILEGRQFTAHTSHTLQTLRRLIHPDIPRHVRRTGNVAFVQEYENFLAIERELARRDLREVRAVNEEIRRTEGGVEAPNQVGDGYIIDPYPGPVGRPTELDDPLPLSRIEILAAVMEGVEAFHRRRLREDEEWMAEATRVRAVVDERSMRQREIEERRGMIADVRGQLQRLQQALPTVALDPQPTQQPEEQQESQDESAMVADGSRSVLAETYSNH